MKVLYKTLFLLAGALVILLFILPLLRGENPYTLRLERIDEGSSYEFPLGTDQLGRDILARATAGGRNSLLIAFTALSLSLSLGALLGATAAFGPARRERFVTGLTDLFLAVPGISVDEVFAISSRVALTVQAQQFVDQRLDVLL